MFWFLFGLPFYRNILNTVQCGVDVVLSVVVDDGLRRYYAECKCSKAHTGQVCTSAGFDVAPSYQAVTADHIQDISTSAATTRADPAQSDASDEEEFYLSTQDMYRLHRYYDYCVITPCRCYIPPLSLHFTPFFLHQALQCIESVNAFQGSPQS